MTNTINWLALLPILMAAGLGLVTMLLAAFVTTQRAKVGYFSLAGLLAIAGVAGANWGLAPGASVTMFNGALTVDAFASFFYVLLAGIAAFTVLLAIPYLEREGTPYGEFYALTFFALAGMFLMVSSRDLITAFLGLETMSLAIYVLVGWRRRSLLSNEATLKYYFLGAFAAGLFLYGLALIYGVANTTNLAALQTYIATQPVMEQPLFVIGALLVVVALAFKVAAVPFHQWVPDVYQGAPMPVTALMATGVKAAAFGLVLRLASLLFASGDLHEMGVYLLSILAVLTMFVGNAFALVQKNVKRMLAYSGVAHTGYLLIGVLALPDADAGAGVLFYLVGYAFTNLAAFACLTFLAGRDEKRQTFGDLAGTAWQHPIAGLGLAVSMFSLIGFPPTVGFFGKYFLFAGAIKAGYTGLVVVAIVNSLLSVAYYLRVVTTVYMKPAAKVALAPSTQATLEPAAPVSAMPWATKLAIGYAAVAVLWAGVGTVNLTGLLPGAEPLVRSAKAAAEVLLAPVAATAAR